MNFEEESEKGRSDNGGICYAGKKEMERDAIEEFFPDVLIVKQLFNFFILYMVIIFLIYYFEAKHVRELDDIK